MALTDVTDGSRILLQGLSPVKVVLSAAVKPGDLIGLSGSTWVQADADAVVYAELVAGQTGASGDTITAYKRALIGGVSGAAIGDKAYLSNTAGGYSSSTGVLGQVVGICTSATEMWIAPDWLTGLSRKVGVFGTPDSFSADEAVEWFFGGATATHSKPAVRIGCENLVTMSAGEIQALLVQGRSLASVTVHQIIAFRAEAIAKSASTVTGDHIAGYFKAEDAKATDGTSTAPTFSGNVASLYLAGQISANPSGDYCALYLNCMANSGSGGNQAWDSIIKIPAGGANGTIALLIDTPAATFAVEGAGTYSTAEGYMLVKVNGSTYRVPFFTGTDA